MTDSPLPANERFGENVRTLRDEKGLSQIDLANAMRERGHPWHQQTVVKVERGIQAARWHEATDLASILKTSLDRLTWGSAEANAVAFLNARRAAVRRSGDAVAAAVTRLLADLDAAAGTEVAAMPDTPRVKAAREDLLATVEEWDLDEAIERGIAGHAHLAEEEG